MDTLLLIGVGLLILSRRQQSGGSQVNPVSYTQSPNAYIGGSLNMGGAVAAPILSSALNGLGRPAVGSFSQPGAFVTTLADPSPSISAGGDSSGFVGPDGIWQ